MTLALAAVLEASVKDICLDFGVEAFLNWPDQTKTLCLGGKSQAVLLSDYLGSIGTG